MDLKHLWLPYTAMGTAKPPYEVVDTLGSLITLADGRELIDGIASWWCAIHGYRHPQIMSAMSKQLETVPHVMLGGLCHEQTYLLAEGLANILPGDLSHVFFSDSGSVSVEVAMKMALQYHQNKGRVGKQRFVHFLGAYHGDTFGTMSLCCPEEGMHTHFHAMLANQLVRPVPQSSIDLEAFEQFIKTHHHEVAGLIIEPLCQGASGMRTHAAAILTQMSEMARRYDVLFIADEVFTGFGRTGALFACEQAGIVPDIICLGKGLTGGAISMAATVATTGLFEAFNHGRAEQALMHGPTFMGNPLAASAANASLAILETGDWQTQVKGLELAFSDAFLPLLSEPNVARVSVLGAIGAVTLKTRPASWVPFQMQMMDLGVWIRPMNNTIYLTPAYNIESNQLVTMMSALKQGLESYTNSIF